MPDLQGCDPAPARSGRVDRAGREHGRVAVTSAGTKVAATPRPAVRAPSRSAPSQPRSSSGDIESRERQAAARVTCRHPRPTLRRRGAARQHDNARTSAHSRHNPSARYESQAFTQVCSELGVPRSRDAAHVPDPAGRNLQGSKRVDFSKYVTIGNFDLTSFRWVDQIFRSQAYPLKKATRPRTPPRRTSSATGPPPRSGHWSTPSRSTSAPRFSLPLDPRRPRRERPHGRRPREGRSADEGSNWRAVRPTSCRYGGGLGQVSAVPVQEVRAN